MNVTDVRNRLAAALSDIPGLRVHARIPDSVVPPAAFIGSHSATYHEYFDGGMTATFPVVVVVSRAGTDDRANEELDRYLTPTGMHSVKEAVEADPTLNSVASDVTATGYDDYGGTLEVAGESFASVVVNVVVVD